jgi:hypothetical protein
MRPELTASGRFSFQGCGRMYILVTFRDQMLSRYATRLEALVGGSGRGVLAQALNAGGEAVRSATVTAETVQTGLPGGTIERAQQRIEASAGSLSYTIWSQGGNVRLKYFGAKEGGSGVTAHPWNRSTFYDRAFITSGPRGRRAASPKLGGQVYRGVGASRRWGGPISLVRSGLFIPTEMTKGQTAAAFDKGVASVLATTVVSRLGAMLP